MVGCDFLQRDFFSHAFFLRLLAAPCEWATLDRFRDQEEDSKDYAFGALLDARIRSGANFASRHPVARLRGRECSDAAQAIQSARQMPPEQR